MVAGVELRGRVAVVTGAGSGIGRATALAFAGAGAQVVVVDVREDAAAAVAQELAAAGSEALAITADVSTAAGNQRAVEDTLARFGRLDVFHANAGVPQAPAAVEEVDEATFDRIMAVNVRSVFLAARAVAPALKRQRRGVFLATASTSALRPRPGVQSYSASKGAVVALVKSLALEWAPFGVRAVSIAPVATDTPMLPRFSGKTAIDDALLAKYLPTIPLGRLNTPEDVARVAVFLASDAAAMMTGTCVEVDGGRSI
jgi:3-oxoacyl-[acyl-carrier protein] reductase